MYRLHTSIAYRYIYHNLTLYICRDRSFPDRLSLCCRIKPMAPRYSGGCDLTSLFLLLQCMIYDV